MSSKSWTTSDIGGLNSGSDCKLHLRLGNQTDWRAKTNLSKTNWSCISLAHQAYYIWASHTLCLDLSVPTIHRVYLGSNGAPTGRTVTRQHLGSQQQWLLTWTHRAIMSAKCDKDLAGYSLLRAGSTILDNASMSWSWGIAHLTRNCSPRIRVLLKVLKYKITQQYRKQMQIWSTSLFCILPVMGHTTC